AEIEAATKRRFFLEPKPNVHLDHFLVLQQGKLETVAPEAPVQENATLELQPVEVALHDPHAAVAKLDGYDVVIADAAKLVVKKKTRRGSRGGRNRKKKTVAGPTNGGEPEAAAPTIHVPSEDLGRDEKPVSAAAAPADDLAAVGPAEAQDLEASENGRNAEPP